MKYRTYITLLLAFCVQLIQGQNISISTFREMPEDITAVSHGTTVIDQNGDKCALIKIETTQTGFSFDVGSLGIVKTQYNPGEVWVYVPHGVKKITISHPTFGVLRDFNFPNALRNGRTYLLKLNATKSPQSVAPKKHLIDNNLSKTVLLTLNKHEIIYCNEQYMDMSTDRNRFSCLLQDTITRNMTFVWNGERKLEARMICLNYIDLQNYDNCILMYSDSTNFFQNIKVEDKVYGPYDGILYLADPFRWADYKGPSMQGIDKEYRTGWPYKDMFVFNAMGDDFLNINGKVLPMPDKYYKYDKGERNWYTQKIYDDLDTLGVSPNGVYKLQFKGNRLVGSHNANLILPYVPTKSKEIHVYNNGKAIVLISNDTYNWHHYLVDIKSNSLHELSDNECFDYKNGEIRKNPLNWDRQFERKDPTIEWDVTYNAICLQDPTLKHTLISKLNVPYVLLDNQKVGNGPALDAFYDPDKRSFSWIAYENNSLVLYEYIL